jgi:nitrite reductase (NADH) small subunit
MWTEVASVDELQRRKKRKLVTVDDKEIALFWIDGEAYALQNSCIHRQRELVRGTLLKGRIVCPGHQWSFEPSTGWCAEKQRYQPTFPTKIEGGAVYVDPEKPLHADPQPEQNRTADA